MHQRYWVGDGGLKGAWKSGLLQGRAGPGGRGLVFCFQEFGPGLRNGEPVKSIRRQSTGWLIEKVWSRPVRTVWTRDQGVNRRD